MATPPLLKHLNERNVLETIRAGAPISRAEISRRAGISKPTVSLALGSLLDAGLVREVDPEPGRPHYGAVYFEPVAEAALVLGLDVGARFLRGALSDLAGVVRARHDVELTGADGERALATIARLRDGLVEAAGVPAERLDAAVVGIPGVIDERTARISLADNVPFLQEPGFAARLGAALDLPLTIENDIGLAALGEQWRGVARGVDDFVFLSVGTGLGAGLVLGGELRRGRHGAAGELDYALVGLGQDVDPCAEAISGHAARLAAGRTTTLEPPFAVPAIFAAARAGDELAREVVEETARRIGLHVAPVGAVADVALVVLGGGLGSNGDLLLEPVRRRLAEWLPFPPRVEVSSLGDAAVLTGALAVGVRAALDRVFENRATGPARSARR